MRNKFSHHKIVSLGLLLLVGIITQGCASPDSGIAKASTDGGRKSGSTPVSRNASSEIATVSSAVIPNANKNGMSADAAINQMNQGVAPAMLQSKAATKAEETASYISTMESAMPMIMVAGLMQDFAKSHTDCHNGPLATAKLGNMMDDVANAIKGTKPEETSEQPPKTPVATPPSQRPPSSVSPQFASARE